MCVCVCVCLMSQFSGRLHLEAVKDSICFKIKLLFKASSVCLGGRAAIWKFG